MIKNLRKPFQIHIYTIAKNEERLCARWYESCKEADGLHVLDTGSSDKTVETLKALGVNVKTASPPFEAWNTLAEYDAIKKRGGRPWRFDDARNENIAMMPDDPNVICIQIDLDETMAPNWKSEILKAWKWDTTKLYYLYAYQMNGDKPLRTILYDKCHARRGYEWRKPVHEIILPKKGTKHVEARSQATLHYHYPDATDKGHSNYLPMLELACREEPEDQRNWLYYGRDLAFAGQSSKAIPVLTKYLTIPTATDTMERSFVCILLADCFGHLKNNDYKERWLLKACGEEPNQREPWVKLAEYYMGTGNNIGGYHCATRALSIPFSLRLFCSDPGAYGYWPHGIASVCAHYAGLENLREKSVVHAWDALCAEPFMYEERLTNYEKALACSGRAAPEKSLKFDVVILSWAKTQQKYEMCKRAISNLRASSPNTEFNIVVVESNRKINDEAFVSLDEYKYDEGVTLMIPNGPFSYNEFLNIAYDESFTSSDAPYMIILNDDVVAFCDGFASKLVEGLKLFSSVCPNGLRESKWGRTDDSKPYVPGYGLDVVNGWCIALDKAIFKAASFETFFPPEIEFYHQDVYYADMLKHRGLRHALITGAQVLHLQAQSIALLNKPERARLTDGQKPVYDRLFAKNISGSPLPEETPSRVFDCFTFFNELDMLEIRLNTLKDVVDRFVLVESTKTFSGKDKPLYFALNKLEPRFKPFLDKIDHIIVTDMPDGTDNWAREFHQRNAIGRWPNEEGIKPAPHDLIMISDVDEIPRPDVIKRRETGAYRMDMYNYSYNNFNTEESPHWRGTVCVPFALLATVTPQEFRDARYGMRAVEDAGWHFTWIGDQACAISKLDSFAHQEFNTEEVRAKLSERMDKRVDFAGRSDKQFEIVPLDERFPAYLIENAQRFGNILPP